MTFVLNCRDTAGIREAHRDGYDTIFVGRPTIWGNPYTHIATGKTRARQVVATRDEAVSMYEDYLLNSPELIARLPELTGKVLLCYCAPQNCHAEVLVKHSNNPLEIIGFQALE